MVISSIENGSFINQIPRVDFSGRIALITGATYGIGRMIAEGFAASGATVIICSRSEDACQKVSKEIADTYSVECRGVAADLSTKNGISALLEAVTGFTESIHVLVNNAGRALIAPIDDYPEDDWDNVFDLNLKAAFFITKGLLPQLRKGAQSTQGWHASVQNIGSMAGINVSHRENYAYAASKAGLHHLTKSLAKHLGANNITANAIAPGLFMTELTSELSTDMVDEITQKTPLNRLGNATDISGISLFLASPSASYLTGVVMPLDGGWSL